MGEEKARVSAELSRPSDAPVLPTVNPAVEKPEPPKPALHPAVYVMYAPLYAPINTSSRPSTDFGQYLDWSEFQCYSLQQMDSLNSGLPYETPLMPLYDQIADSKQTFQSYSHHGILHLLPS